MLHPKEYAKTGLVTQNKIEIEKSDCTARVCNVIKTDDIVIEPEGLRFQPESAQAGIVDIGDKISDSTIVGSVPSGSLGLDPDMNSDNFFSRPVKILDGTWIEGARLALQIKPWFAFFSNKRVINRANNYYAFRGKMKLKITVTGNAMMYGKAIAFYQPLGTQMNMDFTTWSRDKLTLASLHPHVMLDVTESQGGELTLPFFWDKEYCRINGGEMSSIGTLHIHELNVLRHANDLATAYDSRIQVFAWMEDVEFVGPTETNSTMLIPQSGMLSKDTMSKLESSSEIEEADNGPISGPATAVSKIAGSLSDAPVIGKYAKATSMAAKGVATAAKAFGYSRPSPTCQPIKVSQRPTASLANTMVEDDVEKLTLDAKQELSIDPSIVGLPPVDEMDIKYIAGKESLLTTVTWATSDVAESIKLSLAVDPFIHRINGAEHYFTAVAGVTVPFRFWSGSLIFRFEAVKTAFHKGRLMVVYDAQQASTSPGFNTAYTQLWDISDSGDLVMTIGNNQELGLLNRRDMDSPMSDMFTVGTTVPRKITSFSDPIGNGYLTLYVLAPLTLPNNGVGAPAFIDINVYIKGGPDFEVYAPGGQDLASIVINPQSAGGLVFTPESAGAGIDQAGGTTDFAADHGVQKQLPLTYIGESVPSLRQYIKRYELFTTIAVGARYNGATVKPTWEIVPDGGCQQYTFHMYPFYKGKPTGTGFTTKAGGGDYNFCNMLPMQYVTLAFCGWRGGVKWKFIPAGPLVQESEYSGQNLSLTDNVYYVQRKTNASYTNTIVTPGVYTSNSTFASELMRGNNRRFEPCTGDMWRTQLTNGVLEFEIPFYSNKKFIAGRPFDYVSSIIQTEASLAGGFSISQAFGRAQKMVVYCAPGEDFTNFMFVGWPVMYHESLIPEPHGA